jgi:hypothetical protein
MNLWHLRSRNSASSRRGGKSRAACPGPHLDAAKKLARYFRVDSREIGSGKKRSLELRPAKSARPPPDLDAVAAVSHSPSPMHSPLRTRLLL